MFDDALRPDIDVQVSHVAESRYLVDRVAYRTSLSDAFERWLYAPVVGAVLGWASWVRRAHNGSVHRYLVFAAVGLLVVLIAAQ